MTPVEIDDDVKKLISTVCPDSRPIYLPVEPESYAQVNECFPAVAEKIKRDGGSRVIGWQIWKTNIIVEAEFHALWESPQGELKDITPNQFQFQISFFSLTIKPIILVLKLITFVLIFQRMNLLMILLKSQKRSLESVIKGKGLSNMNLS